MLDLFQQRLERIGVRDLFHHVIELVLDIGVDSLGRQNGLDDLLRGLLAVIDGVPILSRVQQLSCVQIASRRVFAITPSALIQRDPGRSRLVR